MEEIRNAGTNNEVEFTVHDVQWTDIKVKRFWDFYNNYPAFDNMWFSKAVGKGLIAFIEKFFTIKGQILDYGIGKGHFSNYLLSNQHIEARACDFSQETVNNINIMFKERSNFKGCFLVQGFPSVFKENEFDILFLIESIEHLTDKYLNPTLAEAYRILKPGGKLVITTPNNENLTEQNVICPDCGGLFHRVQHVRSFTRQSITELVGSIGFDSLFCNATDFNEFGDRKLMYKTRNTILKLMKKSYKAPHLIYIGKKR